MIDHLAIVGIFGPDVRIAHGELEHPKGAACELCTRAPSNPTTTLDQSYEDDKR